MFVPIAQKVESGKMSWQTLTASEQKIVAEAEAVLTSAAKQGHVDAQYYLGSMYQNGEGVALNHKEAAPGIGRQQARSMLRRSTA
jgi:TPR repeat protein